MNPSNPTEYQKQPAAYPPARAATATGVPVALSDQSQAHEVPWSTGLCDCFDDIPSCCLTFCCPCITFGRIAEIVDKGATSCGSFAAIYALISCLTGLGCLYSCVYRSKLRQQYLLKNSACGDCFLHCCCEHCALCQEYRELKNRGFDPSLGWQGNLERQTRGVAMAPVVQGGMKR